MEFKVIYDENNNIKFNINNKIYNEDEINLNKIGFDIFIQNIKSKYLSNNNNKFITLNNSFKLNNLLYNAEIIYNSYLTFTYKSSDISTYLFNKYFDEIINLDEFNIIKDDLYIIKCFFSYSYIKYKYKL